MFEFSRVKFYEHCPVCFYYIFFSGGKNKNCSVTFQKIFFLPISVFVFFLDISDVDTYMPGLLKVKLEKLRRNY